MYTHNAPGAIVTHYDVFGDQIPLCGFLATCLDGVEVDEECTRDASRVTCLDCRAAMETEEGP